MGNERRKYGVNEMVGMAARNESASAMKIISVFRKDVYNLLFLNDAYNTRRVHDLIGAPYTRDKLMCIVVTCIQLYVKFKSIIYLAQRSN